MSMSITPTSRPGGHAVERWATTENPGFDSWCWQEFWPPCWLLTQQTLWWMVARPSEVKSVWQAITNYHAKLLSKNLGLCSWIPYNNLKKLWLVWETFYTNYYSKIVSFIELLMFMYNSDCGSVNYFIFLFLFLLNNDVFKFLII